MQKGGYEVNAFLFILAPEDLIKHGECWLVHLVEFRYGAGEGDPERDGDIVLFTAAELVERDVAHRGCGRIP